MTQSDSSFIEPDRIIARTLQELDSLVTPFDVEREIVDLNKHIDAAPMVVKEYHSKLREARAKYKHEFNKALLNSPEGNAADRRADAELKCEAWLAVQDVAEVQYKYMIDLLDAYKTKLRALQSISALMRAQMFQGNV